MKIDRNGQEPDLDWLKDLWCVCLSSKPSTATKSLAFKWLGRQWKAQQQSSKKQRVATIVSIVLCFYFGVQNALRGTVV